MFFFFLNICCFHGGTAGNPVHHLLFWNIFAFGGPNVLFKLSCLHQETAGNPVNHLSSSGMHSSSSNLARRICFWYVLGDVLHKLFCACTDLSFQADEQQWNHWVRGEWEGFVADGKWCQAAHHSICSVRCCSPLLVYIYPMSLYVCIRTLMYKSPFVPIFQW